MQIFRILGLQEQHLGNHQVGDIIIHREAQKDDPVLQQPGIDIISPFTVACLIDYYGD